MLVKETRLQSNKLLFNMLSLNKPVFLSVCKLCRLTSKRRTTLVTCNLLPNMELNTANQRTDMKARDLSNQMRVNWCQM